jgi:hypothetical protein
MAKNSKATSAAKPAIARSTAARIPPAAPRGARRNIGEYTNAHVLDRIESTITVTTFRDLNPFCSPIAARARPFAVHVHEGAQTQLAALTHTLLANSAVQDQ